MNVQEAVDAPRFHHQWLPDFIRIEKQGFPQDVITALEARGHTVKADGNMGDVHAIWIDPNHQRALRRLRSACRWPHAGLLSF